MNTTDQQEVNFKKAKLINLVAIPFSILPPFNFLVPYLLMFVLKQKNDIVKQLLTIQLLWSMGAPLIIFVALSLNLDTTLLTVLIGAIFLTNTYLVLKNNISLGKTNKLAFVTKYNMF